jgi:putative MATE family efflux protein
MLRTKLFDDKIFYKTLFTIALPIMLQNLFNSFVNMVDTVMVGRLGTVAIAGVGLGNQVFFLLNMILFGVSSGGAVFTAQFWGKRDVAGIRKTTGICLTIVISVAALFTVACIAFPRAIIGVYSADPDVIREGSAYLRALAPSFIPFSISFVFTLVMRTIEKVKLSMATTFLSLGVNVFFNWLLIFGIGPFPALGVMGAGIATAISRCIEMIILVSVSYARKYALAGPPRDYFRFDAAMTRRFFRIAAPVILNELLWSFGITAQNIIFARTHTDAIAAFNIVNTLSNLTWAIFIGLGNGCSVLIGNRIGAGEELVARSYASKITRFGPILAAGIALILIPLSYILPYLFNVSENVFAIIAGMMVILSLSYPFRAFNMSMVIGVCRAGGDTVFSVFYDLFFMWCFSLPLAAVASFVFHAPAWLIYLCICTEDPLKMILGIWRLKSGKWLHNVT